MILILYRIDDFIIFKTLFYVDNDGHFNVKSQ